MATCNVVLSGMGVGPVVSPYIGHQDLSQVGLIIQEEYWLKTCSPIHILSICEVIYFVAHYSPHNAVFAYIYIYLSHKFAFIRLALTDSTGVPRDYVR